MGRRIKRSAGTVADPDEETQLDGLRAVAIGLIGVEHFGGPWVRGHFARDPGSS
jgi:hypothetical protein